MRGLPTSVASASTRAGPRPRPAGGPGRRAGAPATRSGRVDAPVEGGAGGGDRLDDGAGAGARRSGEVGAGGDLGGGHGAVLPLTAGPRRRSAPGPRRGLACRALSASIAWSARARSCRSSGPSVRATPTLMPSSISVPDDLDRLLHRPGDPLGEVWVGDPVGHLVGEDDELVAAGAGDDVGRAYAAAQAGGRHLAGPASPTACPWWSLIGLKWSRSQNSSAPPRRSRSRRSNSDRRFRQAGQLVGVGERRRGGRPGRASAGSARRGSSPDPCRRRGSRRACRRPGPTR